MEAIIQNKMRLDKYDLCTIKEKLVYKVKNPTCHQQKEKNNRGGQKKQIYR